MIITINGAQSKQHFGKREDWINDLSSAARAESENRAATFAENQNVSECDVLLVKMEEELDEEDREDRMKTG